MIHTVVVAQEDSEKKIQFHGSNNIYYQYSDHPGIGQLVPESFFRNDLNASLVLFGIPLCGGLFYTTENNDSRQQMNHYYLELDVNSLTKALKPEINVPSIPDYNLPKPDLPEFRIPDPLAYMPDDSLPVIKKPDSNKLLKFLSGFKTLQVGRTRPRYSELILSHVSVDGINIEYNPRIIYAAFVHGELKKTINNTFEPYGHFFPQQVTFGKLGFGEKNGSHILLSLMKAKDHQEDIVFPDPVSLYPAENIVTGLDTRISFLEKKIYVQLEGAVSLFTENQNSTTLDSFTDLFPEWVASTFNPTLSTHIDYAWRIEPGINLKTTNINAEYSIVGPGYKTLGNPILINDKKTVKGNINQSFFKNQLSFNASYNLYENDLLNWNNNKTESQTISLNTSIRFKNLPYLVINYSPNTLTNISEANTMVMDVKVLNGIVGYNYHIKTTTLQTSLTYFQQNSIYDYNKLQTSNESMMINLNQQVSFENGFQIMGEAGATMASYSGINRDIRNYGLGCIFRLGKSIRNNVSIVYNDNIEHDKNFGFRYGLSIRIKKIAQVKVSVSENMRKMMPNELFNHKDFIMRVSLLVKW